MASDAQEQLKPAAISSAQPEVPMVAIEPNSQPRFCWWSFGSPGPWWGTSALLEGTAKQEHWALFSTCSSSIRQRMSIKTGFKSSPKHSCSLLSYGAPNITPRIVSNAIHLHLAQTQFKWAGRMLKHRPVQSLGSKSPKVVLSLCFNR